MSISVQEYAIIEDFKALVASSPWLAHRQRQPWINTVLMNEQWGVIHLTDGALAHLVEQVSKPAYMASTRAVRATVMNALYASCNTKDAQGWAAHAAHCAGVEEDDCSVLVSLFIAAYRANGCNLEHATYLTNEYELLINKYIGESGRAQ